MAYYVVLLYYINNSLLSIMKMLGKSWTYQMTVRLNQGAKGRVPQNGVIELRGKGQTVQSLKASDMEFGFYAHAVELSERFSTGK